MSSGIRSRLYPQKCIVVSEERLRQLDSNLHFEGTRLSRTMRLGGHMQPFIQFSMAPSRYTIRRGSVWKDFLNDRILEQWLKAEI
jgi:hypothetical protein